jgi:hypothetical protein
MADSIPEDWDIRCTYEYRKGWEAGSHFMFDVMRQIEKDMDNKYKAALISISKNTCCKSCREAALVAKKALKGA